MEVGRDEYLRVFMMQATSHTTSASNGGSSSSNGAASPLGVASSPDSNADFSREEQSSPPVPRIVSSNGAQQSDYRHGGYNNDGGAGVPSSVAAEMMLQQHGAGHKSIQEGNRFHPYARPQPSLQRQDHFKGDRNPTAATAAPYPYHSGDGRLHNGGSSGLLYRRDDGGKRDQPAERGPADRSGWQSTSASSHVQNVIF